MACQQGSLFGNLIKVNHGVSVVVDDAHRLSEFVGSLNYQMVGVKIKQGTGAEEKGVLVGDNIESSDSCNFLERHD